MTEPLYLRAARLAAVFGRTCAYDVERALDVTRTQAEKAIEYAADRGLLVRDGWVESVNHGPQKMRLWRPTAQE